MLSITALSSAGTLRVTGDDEDNVIVVSRTAAGAILVNNGAVAIQGDVPTVANTTHFHIVAAGGNDRVTLDETNGPLPGAAIFGGAGNDTLTGGSGEDFIEGEAGGDTAFMGGGNDAFAWNNGDGSDVVDGQAGFDSLYFNSTDQAEKFEISDTGAGTPFRRARFTRDVGNVVMDLGTVEELNLSAQGGTDTITVNDLTATDFVTVNLDLAGTGPAGDGEADAVILNGTGGEDVALVQSIGNSIAANASLFPFVNIINADPSLDTLTINTLGEGDTIDASSLAPNAIKLALNGGDGGDEIFGSGGNDSVTGGAGHDKAFLGAGDDTFIWNAGDGSDVVEGQAGVDTLIFNGSTADENIDLSADNTRTRLTDDIDNVLVDFDGVEQAAVSPIAGADNVRVHDLTGAALKFIKVKLGADAQVDNVVVDGTGAADAIDIDGDFANGVTVNGLAAQVKVLGAIGPTEALTVNALGGNDVLDASDLVATNANEVLKLVVVGGAGNDTLTGSQGFDTFVWNGGDGNDLIDGGDGEDTVTVNGADVAERFDLSAIGGGRARFTRDVDGAATDFGSVEEVDVNPLGGADAITVNDLSGTPVTEIFLNLAAAAGGTAGDAQADSVTINGRSVADAIPVIGRNGVVVVNGDVNNGSNLPYFTVVRTVEANDALRVNGNGGGDNIDIDVQTPVKVSIDGGTQHDTITLTATMPGAAVTLLPSTGDDTVNVRAGAAAGFTASQRLGELNLASNALATLTPAGGGNNVLTLGSLNLTETSTLNITNNGLILDYAPNTASLISAVQILLARGYHNGAWDGAGITSSLADASNFALGFAEAADVAPGGTFLNQPTDNTAVVVRFTRYGDANLDGKVDFNDLVHLAQNYNTTVAANPHGSWNSGDFTYDGAVNFTDLVQLAQNTNAPVVPAQGPAVTGLAVKVAPLPTKPVAVRRGKRR
jgi:Ca2+-binding RTX toxin-like protein